MPTTYVRTVGTASRDYSTIQAAEDDIPNIATSADLVSNDESIIFILFEDGNGFTQTFDEHVVVSGTTCDVTRNVTFIVHPDDKHDGTRESGVRLHPSTDGHAFEIDDDHIVIIDMEIRVSSGNSSECVRVNTGNVGVRVDSCIIETTVTQADGVYAGNWNVGSATFPIVVQNCYFNGNARAGVHAQIFNGANLDHYFDVINCTFANQEFAIGWRAQQGSSTVTLRIINCLSGDNGGDLDATGGGSGSLVTTGSSDNFGEITGTVGDPAFPDNTQITYTDNTSPGAGSWAILVDVTGTWNVQNHLLVDDADNDVQNTAAGPRVNSLVPTYDAIGNNRAGTNADAGFHQVTDRGQLISAYLKRMEHTQSPNTLLRM